MQKQYSNDYEFEKCVRRCWRERQKNYMQLMENLFNLFVFVFKKNTQNILEYLI